MMSKKTVPKKILTDMTGKNEAILEGDSTGADRRALATAAHPAPRTSGNRAPASNQPAPVVRVA